MKIAVLADIHGNADALEAVITDAQSRGVEEFWVLGDLVGYGPEPNRTIDLLKTLPGKIILGNYDRKLVDYLNGETNSVYPKTVLKRLLFEWTAQEITPQGVEWLSSLPAERMFQIEGRDVLLAHGIPGDDEGTLMPQAPHEHFVKIISEHPEANLICLGHTHKPLNQTVNGVRFLNPGTLGRSEDGNPAASYVMLTITPKTMRAGFLRIDYDNEATAKKIHERQLPLAIESLYRQGLRLKDVLKGPPPALDNVEEDPRVKAAKKFVKKCHFNTNHENQVAKTAAILFDAMWNHHGLGYEEKVLLICAAYLHDIGWMSGKKKHHKNSRDMILEDTHLPLNKHERMMVALMARYHRNALPQENHKFYKNLSLIDRWKINMLAGILRIADGIDHSHLSEVQSIQCQSNRTHVLIGVAGESSRGVLANALAAQEKSNMLAWALKKDVNIILNTREAETPVEKDHRTE